MRITKHRRGKWRPTIEGERERKVQRAVAKEMERAAEVRAALRERLDPKGRRFTYDADGRPAA